MTIENKIVEVGGSRWHILEARDMCEAEHAIAIARCTGSTGSIHKENKNGIESVLAIVNLVT